VTSNNKLSISDSLKTLTMVKKFNINVLSYIENNPIANTQSKNKNIFNTKKINYLGYVNFDSKIYNFDTNYVSDDIIALSEKILSTINKI
jgi:Mrp family chromosome partitioning ATPase